MPPEIVDASAFSPDVQDFLRALHAHEVKFMIVGGEAVIFYGHIRVTGDIDVYYDREHDNAVSLFKALEDLIQNKRASGGPKDQDDLPFLLEALK